MHFTTTLATLSALLSAALAAPSPQYYNSANSIRPTTLSQYKVWTGAKDYATAEGRIYKTGRESDITTLVTFDIPQWTAGQKCEVAFELDNSATLTGSQQFDVFTSLAPATGPATGWPNGNLRDQFAGRAQAYKPGRATWLPGYGYQGSLIARLWNGATAGPYIIVTPA
ncbi:hypothetical protein H2199_004551 [Coniosporium tulheliwenetii]|uniref:Uncharacterized protein n=1 Tax=Coniosporium tulheliwenetii TaxID=3383036 RepID=A0ACC2Z5Q7_9PEZI|nr:hypothetical protein H2199_004551 [Cladosporium sp. JES 115]